MCGDGLKGAGGYGGYAGGYLRSLQVWEKSVEVGGLVWVMTYNQLKAEEMSKQSSRFSTLQGLL